MTKRLLANSIFINGKKERLSILTIDSNGNYLQIEKFVEEIASTTYYDGELLVVNYNDSQKIDTANIFDFDTKEHYEEKLLALTNQSDKIILNTRIAIYNLQYSSKNLERLY